MNKIRELRNKRHISLRDLANDVHMSFSNLGSIERGEVQLREDNAKMFADYFGVSIDYIMGNESPKEDNVKFALHGLENDLNNEEKEMILNLAQNLVDMKKKGSK